MWHAELGRAMDQSSFLPINTFCLATEEGKASFALTVGESSLALAAGQMPRYRLY